MILRSLTDKDQIGREDLYSCSRSVMELVYSHINKQQERVPVSQEAEGLPGGWLRRVERGVEPKVPQMQSSAMGVALAQWVRKN